MFGWLRKRLVKEHAKLLIQNGAACEVLAEGWYTNDPQTSDYLKRRAVLVSQLATSFDSAKGLGPEAMDEMLMLNKELRRLHDFGPAVTGESFDAEYRPLGGYDQAIARFLGLR